MHMYNCTKIFHLLLFYWCQDPLKCICHAHQVRGVEPTVLWQTRLRHGGRAAN